MAYRVVYKGTEIGRIERSPRDRGGLWEFTGTGSYWGKHLVTEEFSEAVDYAVKLAQGVLLVVGSK